MDAVALQPLPFFDTHTHAHYAMQKLGLTSDFTSYQKLVADAQQPSVDGRAVTLDGAVNVWCETAELVPGAAAQQHEPLLALDGVRERVAIQLATG